MEIYGDDTVPFRVVDTIGFEPSFIGRTKAVNAVRKWSKEGLKKSSEDNEVNVIWFCVEGTASKLFRETIDSFVKATKLWPSVPVIVVITKSYSIPEREKNIKMVRDALSEHKQYKKNCPSIIPVVAEAFPLTDTIFAPPDGITALIEVTNALMPEGKRAAKNDIAAFNLSRKRALAQSSVGLAVITAAGKGLLPGKLWKSVRFADMYKTVIYALSRIYELDQTEETKKFVEEYVSYVENEAFNQSINLAIKAIQKIPAIKIPDDVVDAVISASVVGVLGEVTVHVFEELYLGERTVDDLEWVKTIFDNKWADHFTKTVSYVVETSSENDEKGNVAKHIAQSVMGAFGTHKAK